MFFFFFFNDTATTEIYTLSLHDALPISEQPKRRRGSLAEEQEQILAQQLQQLRDRKSTRLNSSHVRISYAVFCLKKKKRKKKAPGSTTKPTQSAITTRRCRSQSFSI